MAMKEPGVPRMANSGRPSLGALMKDAFRVDTWRREHVRDLRPLRRLIPFVGAHRLDAALGAFFLVLSSAALLAMTGGMRMVIDQGFNVRDRVGLAHIFLELAGVAAVLALATGLRMYFLYSLGERVVAGHATGRVPPRPRA